MTESPAARRARKQREADDRLKRPRSARRIRSAEMHPMPTDPTTNAASEPLRVIVPPGRSYGIIDTNREEPPMTTTERTHDTAAVEGDIALIEQSLDHMKRVTADNSMRAHNAAQAGATLAYAVENFLRGSDPCDDCTEALREAWRVFMARHSGNFTDSAMVVNGT